MQGNNYLYIEDDEVLAGYLKELKNSGKLTVAIDFEGEFNLHQYGNRLCLVQLYDSERSLVIDPFRVSRGKIAGILENRHILKVMYDSSSDRTLLKRDMGININSILDLKPAVDLLDPVKKDLSSVLWEFLGIRVKGKKKYQMYNWTKRPISLEALQYSLSDVQHLFDLRDSLFEKIWERSLLERYFHLNLKIQNKEIPPSSTPRIFKTEKFKRLSKNEQSLLRRLFDVREESARKLNLPPNLVVENDLLFKLVQRTIKLDEVGFHRRVKKKEIQEIKRRFGSIFESLES